MRCSKLDGYGVFEGDVLTEVLDFPFWRWDLDVHALNCHRVASSALFDVVLEMIWVFVGWSCRPCTVVTVVRSSSMVVVCFSEPLMRRMSSANLWLERFVLVWCAASLTPWLHLFQFSALGFMMFCKSELVVQERAERVSLLCSSLEVEALASDVCVHCCSLVVELL